MGYATLTDLYNTIPASQLGALTTTQQQAALDARSAYADAKMRARYALPLGQPYDPALVRAVCDLAAWDLIQLRGYNPRSGSDVNYQIRAIGVDGKGGAQRLLDDVERQCAHFAVVEAISPSPAIPSPLVVSQPLQDWNPGMNPANGGCGGSGIY
jgi:hypothetical protein